MPIPPLTWIPHTVEVRLLLPGKSKELLLLEVLFSCWLWGWPVTPDTLVRLPVPYFMLRKTWGGQYLALGVCRALGFVLLGNSGTYLLKQTHVLTSSNIFGTNKMFTCQGVDSVRRHLCQNTEHSLCDYNASWNRAMGYSSLLSLLI